MMNDRHSAHEGFGRSAPTNFVGTAWAAWTAAAVVVAIAVLSTFALSRPDANGVSGPVAGGYGNQGNGASAAGPEQGGDQGQAGGGSAGQDPQARREARPSAPPSQAARALAQAPRARAVAPGRMAATQTQACQATRSSWRRPS